VSSAQLKMEKRDKLENSEFALNHPTFLKEQIMEFYDLFELYSNRQSEKIDLKDILATAKTLGLDDKYRLVFKVLSEVQEENLQNAKALDITDSVDFHAFIDLLTHKLVKKR